MCFHRVIMSIQNFWVLIGYKKCCNFVYESSSSKWCLIETFFFVVTLSSAQELTMPRICYYQAAITISAQALIHIIAFSRHDFEAFDPLFTYFSFKLFLMIVGKSNWRFGWQKWASTFCYNSLWFLSSAGVNLYLSDVEIYFLF